MRVFVVIGISLLFIACGSDTSSNSDSGAGDSDSDSDGDTDADSDSDSDGDYDCPAGELGASLGREDFLLGGAMEESSFSQAPFDIRYQYVAGAVPQGGPCSDCASGCYVNGASCANTEGCEWWGCWQYDQEPPGRFVANFISQVDQAGGIPMISYYIWYSVAGYVEGSAEVAQLQDEGLVGDLLADFGFLMEVVAETPSIPVIVHIEPDFWGYVHHENDDPSQVPASLSSAPPECDGLGDHAAGFAACFINIARNRAPNVLVAFHASAWGTGNDALNNTDDSYDIPLDAYLEARFMRELGADQGDLIVVEQSDRDAAFNDRWWDPTNATLPSFDQALLWVRSLGDELGLAPLWWQVPYGHMGLENECDRYEDNRLDYFFDHPGEFSATGALGIAFGGGATCMTSAQTDGGHFLSRADTYYAGQPPSLCEGYSSK